MKRWRNCYTHWENSLRYYLRGAGSSPALFTNFKLINIMEKFTTEELKLELERRGYYTQNLWCIEDVQSIFACTEEDAQEVLNSALNNDTTMGQIWFSIKLFGEYKNLIEL